MDKPIITNKNYFSKRAQMEYLGASQFKSFLDCPARTMAEIKGKYERTDTKALLMGSYVDAHFSGEMDQFVKDHPDIFKKDGSLKADYLQCDKMIERAESDKLFKKYMSGEPQVVMTGTLFGSQYKIKMDSYFPGQMIVDLKCMRDIKPVYKDGSYQTFIDAWRYDLQMYIYQQIEAQNSESGELLPCYLAVITKEEEPDIHLIEIPQWKLNGAAALVKHYTPIFQAYKDGYATPPRCEHCSYCHKTKKIIKPESYEDLMEVME